MPEAPHQIGQGGGNQEVLLYEAQCLSHAGGIVRIKHSCYRFGCETLSQSCDKITTAEFLKVKVIRRGRGPQAERVDSLTSVANDRAIKWKTNQTGGATRQRTQAPAVQFE
jgi:hypothetical protein